MYNIFKWLNNGWHVVKSTIIKNMYCAVYVAAASHASDTGTKLSDRQQKIKTRTIVVWARGRQTRYQRIFERVQSFKYIRNPNRSLLIGVGVRFVEEWIFPWSTEQKHFQCNKLINNFIELISQFNGIKILSGYLISKQTLKNDGNDAI